MSNKLALSEVFYSIQGEGPTCGHPAVFIRLGGCNLMCGGMGTQFTRELENNATWRCDTIEVWMKAQSREYKDVLTEECITAIKNGANVVLTGGEPLMQQNTLIEFVKWLRSNVKQECYIEIETNGTIMPTSELLLEVQQFNVSPKLSNSGNDRSLTYRSDVIEVFNQHRNSCFKFVVFNEQDWKEIKTDYIPLIDMKNVWLMPAGEDQDLLSKTKQYVAELAKENHLKYTSRLHIDIWNKKTGV